MSTSDSVNGPQAYIFMPEQASPPIPASGTVDACSLYCDGADLMLSVNGGAYAAITTGGASSLNTAYLAGNQINLTQAAGAVILSSARTSGNILQIATTNAPASVLGAITAISVDMSSLGTSATPATVNLPAVSIVGAFSSVAKTTGLGLVQILSSYRNATAVSIGLRNKQALTGSAVRIGWDATNYEGTGTGNVLTGQTHVVTIDAATNVNATAQEVIPLRILMPATSNGNSGAIYPSTLQTSGVLYGGDFSAATTLTGSFAIMSVNVSGIVSPTAQIVGGIQIVLPGSTSASSFGYSVSTSQTAGYLFRGELGVVTLTDGLTGILLDMDDAVGGAHDVLGADIYMPNTSSGNSAGVRVVSLQTAGYGVYVDMQGPGGFNAAYFQQGVVATSQCVVISHGGATPGAASIALRLTGAEESCGLELSQGDAVAVSNTDEGRIRYNQATQTFQASMSGAAFVDFATGTSVVSLQAAYTGGATIALTATNPIAISMAAGVSSNAITVTGSTTASNSNIGFLWTRNAVPAAASTWTGKAISIQNTPTETNSFTDASTGLITINHAPVNGAGTMTDTTVGLSVTMTPNVASTGAAVSISMSNANAQGSAITIASSGTNANQLAFTSAADGTGAHLKGPATASFVIKAGTSTGSAAGRDITIASGAASTSGAGGSIFPTTGAAAGAGANGGDFQVTLGALAGTGRRGYFSVVGALAETTTAVTFNAAGTTTIPCGDGNAFTTTATGATTWSFSKPMDTGFVYSFILVLTNGGAGVQTWTTAGTGGTAVKWPGGTAPTLQAAGVDVLVFFTTDAGTTWRGVLSQSDSK